MVAYDVGCRTEQDVADLLVLNLRQPGPAYIIPDLGTLQRHGFDGTALRRPRRPESERSNAAPPAESTTDEDTREQLLGQALRELEHCCPDAKTLLVAFDGVAAAPEIEFLGPQEVDEMYWQLGWNSAREEGAYGRAAELIVRALKTSPPPYLRISHHGLHEFAIADTAWGRAMLSQDGGRA